MQNRDTERAVDENNESLGASTTTHAPESPTEAKNKAANAQINNSKATAERSPSNDDASAVHSGADEEAAQGPRMAQKAPSTKSADVAYPAVKPLGEQKPDSPAPTTRKMPPARQATKTAQQQGRPEQVRAKARPATSTTPANVPGSVVAPDQTARVGAKPQAASPADAPSGAKARSASPADAPSGAKARPAAPADAPSGVKAPGPTARVAARPQAAAPKANAAASRAQADAAVPKRPAGPKSVGPAREDLGGTRVLARRPAGANNTALAKRPSSTGKIQVRPGRPIPARPGKAPNRAQSPNRPQAVRPRSPEPRSAEPSAVVDSAAPKQELSIANTANTLAKKFSSFSLPSIVLPSNERKIPSEENTSVDFDTRSPFAKARDFFVDNIRTPQAAAIGVLLVIYLVGSAFWSFRYLPGTKINDLDASWATPGSVASRLESEVPSYSASASGQGVDLSVNATSIDLAFDADTWEDSARSYLPSFGWPIQLITKRDFHISDGVSFDDKKLEGMVTAAVQSANKTAVEPKNATFKFDEQKDQYVAVKEEKGTAVNLAHTCETVKTGVSSLQTSIPITLEDLSVPTLTITSSDYASVLEQANQLAHMSIPLTYNGEVIYTIDSELLRSWLTVNKSSTVTADIDKVTEWARGPFSQQYDTVGTQRTYIRADDGKEVTVAGGTYGWSVDGKKLANLIRTHVTAHSDEPVEVPMTSTGKVLVLNGQDWGPRYIDVDLSEQYVRMFDENSDVIIESPCVTGNISEGRSTVEGVYFIEYKESPSVLVGLDYDGDGVADYETPVNFWMPFYGGYGLHDAYWRSYFGGSTFTYDGSHGCVNLPYYAAEIIYSVAEAGDVVVVHW